MKNDDFASSSISIDECIFQGISSAAVHYTSDPTISNKVNFRRSHVTLKENEGQQITPSVQMLVSNDDMMEISNNVFTSSKRGGIHIYLYNKKAMVNIINNVISGNKNGSEAIYIIAFDNDGSDKLLMAGNYLSHNDIAYPHDMVVIKNVAVTVRENMFYDNTVKYTVNWVGASNVNITSIMTGNIFLLNKGYLHTLLLESNGNEIIKENYFTNPSNEFELSTQPSLFPDANVNASNNWWGTVDLQVIMRRIKDRRRATSLPTVIYEPILQSPARIFSTGKC